MQDEDELSAAAAAMPRLCWRGRWMGQCRRVPVVRRLVGAGGRGQAMSDVRERCATAGAQEAVVSDCGETLGEHMLEEASEERFGGKRSALPLMAGAILESESDVAVLKFFDTVVGDGKTPDGGGKGGDPLCAGSGRLTMGYPGLVPDVGRHVIDQIGFGEFLLARAAEEVGEGSDRHQPIR